MMELNDIEFELDVINIKLFNVNLTPVQHAELCRERNNLLIKLELLKNPVHLQKEKVGYKYLKINI